MARKTTNRDIENNHSVNADINGDGNKTTQAGRDLIQGDFNKIPDEGRPAADPFSIFFEIAYSIGQFLFKIGIGDRLERLFIPASTIALASVLTFYATVAQAAFEPTGTIGAVVDAAAYTFRQIGVPLAEVLATHPAIMISAIIVVGAPIAYTLTKLGTTCRKCEQPFAMRTITRKYPSRASVDGEGNRHVPMDRKTFCIYCDNDEENAGAHQGGSSPQAMTDGGGGDGDTGACCCSCHSED